MFNPITILLHVINAVILLVALYFLLLKPVRRFMSARTARIEAQLQSVTDAQQTLKDQKQGIQTEMSTIRKAAETDAAQDISKAEQQAQKIVSEAHAEASQILAQAHTDAEAMKARAQDEMKNEVANLGVALASKLLKREVTQKDHEQLVEEFLEKVT